MDRIVAQAASLAADTSSRSSAGMRAGRRPGGRTPRAPAAQPPAAPAPRPSPPRRSRPRRRRSSMRWSPSGEGPRREAARRAVELYRQALAIRPSWPRAVEPRHGALRGSIASPRRATRSGRRARDPQNGTAWAFKGLCEFRLKNYDTALADLHEARTRGVAGSREIADVARYHSAILLTRVGQFDQALKILSDFGLEGNDSPRHHRSDGAGGRCACRMLPGRTAGHKRELVLMAGRARYFRRRA